ncbi:MAG: alkaline phosphatase PafA [Gillisia sp.]
MKKFVLVLLFLSSFCSIKAQTSKDVSLAPNKPRLVVGVVVDQMRYDYLTRFWNQFGDDGFKRLVGEGYIFKNHNYNYIPTFTAPGHSSIYTGTTPENHGIISNNWYDKFNKKMIYCVQDDSVEPVGTDSPAGKMSPKRLLSTTVTDENRLFTQLKGKSIGIALKDRSSILPAGHAANAAYWFVGEDEGKFITSSYYMNELPKWVQDFNSSGKVKSYLKPWNTLKDINSYKESGNDKNNFEGGFTGKKDATFPYDLKELSKKNRGYDILKSTPYGNSITADFAIAALDGEDLGQDDITDILAVSFSSTDYIGHNFGVNSKEIEDAYVRLDADLARLLKALDEKVGKGNYTLFLTADHGGVEVPAYLETLNIPANYFDEASFEKDLSQKLKDKFGKEDLIESVSNNQIFFNYKNVEDAKINKVELQDFIASYVVQYPHVSKVFTRHMLESNDYPTGMAELVQNGFNERRSGDVVVVLDPATIVYSKTGSTHGTGFAYDTHVPLIFFGKGIKHGSTFAPSYVNDIAPTVSAILGIQFPSADTGEPLLQVLETKESE